MNSKTIWMAGCVGCLAVASFESSLFAQTDSSEVKTPVAAADIATDGLPDSQFSVTDADWSSYNHDVLGWRFNSAESALSPANAAQLVEKWRFPPKDSTKKIGAIHATPSVVGGCVYFGTATYPAFYKLKPDGSLDWVYRPPNEGLDPASLPKGGSNLIDAERGIMTSALVTDTSVYFGDSAGVFYALDRESGREKWKVNTRKEGFPGHHPINIFNSSPILADGKVVVGGGGYEHPYPLDPNYPCCTGRGFVVAFNPSTGNVEWKYDVGTKPEKFDEPVVIVDGNGRHLYYYGPSTSSVWSTPSYDADTARFFRYGRTQLAAKTDGR